MLNNLTSHMNYRIYSYQGRVNTFQLIKKGHDLYKQTESGIQWLQKAATEFSEILFNNDFIPKSKIKLLIESVNEMKEDMIRNNVDLENLKVSDLGIFASTNRNLTLRTIHRTKGLEFDAVAIVDLHDGKIPHFTATTADEINESKRILYVAITRAKRLLMYITDEENPLNRPSRFLYTEGLDLI